MSIQSVREMHPVRKFNWIILGSLGAIIVVAAVFATHIFTHWSGFAALQQDAAAIENIPGVQAASVVDAHQWMNSTSCHNLVVTVRITNPSVDTEALAERIVRTLFARNSRAAQYEGIRVTAVHGYDLGIAHSQVTRTFGGTPAQWKAHLSVHHRPIA